MLATCEICFTFLLKRLIVMIPEFRTSMQLQRTGPFILGGKGKELESTNSWDITFYEMKPKYLIVDINVLINLHFFRTGHMLTNANSHVDYTQPSPFSNPSNPLQWLTLRKRPPRLSFPQLLGPALLELLPTCSRPAQGIM